MKELDALQAAVAKNTEVVAAAIAAINAKAGVDPLKLVALTTEITADSTTLEAALAASAPKNGEPPVI